MLLFSKRNTFLVIDLKEHINTILYFLRNFQRCICLNQTKCRLIICRKIFYYCLGLLKLIEDMVDDLTPLYMPYIICGSSLNFSQATPGTPGPDFFIKSVFGSHFFFFKRLQLPHRLCRVDLLSIFLYSISIYHISMYLSIYLSLDFE